MARDPGPEPLPTPGALLDALRAHPEWSVEERDALLDRVVSGFTADDVVAAVRDRLGDLGGPDAEVLLRLVEANPRPRLLRSLGEALGAQPGLPPERAWEALAVLDGAGVLNEFPGLSERWDELNDALDGEAGSVEELVEQIEGDPDGVWLALQGLAAVEPEVRAEIVAGLARPGGRLGPGLSEFVRLLAYAHDPATRGAAVGLLASPSSEHGADYALIDLARHHPSRSVRDDLGRRVAALGAEARDRAAADADAVIPAPRLARSLVTPINGHGRATVVLGSVRGADHVTAVFGCDVVAGVWEVFGDLAAAPAPAGVAFDEFAGNLGGDAVEGDHPFALGLLAGCLALCGPGTSPALRFWVEATAGPDFRPQPFPADVPGWEPAEVPFEEMGRRTREVLDACPDWSDDSPLSFELAEEILLREGDAPIDPHRDSGAFRFFFEHRLRGQLERYRRMLLWMAGFWRSDGSDDLALSALALAWQLSEAQNVVPGHPFAVALTARSLAAARDGLKHGIDPRGRKRR